MAAATASSTYVNNLMFAQQPLFWAGVTTDFVLYNRITSKGNKGVQKDGGKYYVKETDINEIGYAARAMTSETMTRPTAYPAKPILPVWSLKDVWCPVQFTGKARNQGELISMVDIESIEMKNAMLSFRWYLEHALRGSVAGYLTTIVSVDSSTVLTVTDASVLKPNLRVDSYTTPGTPKMDSSTIASVNLVTNQVTLNSTTSAAAGDYIGVEDSHGYQGDNLAALVNDGAAHSVAAAGATYLVQPATAAYAGLTRSTTSGYNAFIRDYTPGKFKQAWLFDFMAKCQNHQAKNPHFTGVYANPLTVAALLDVIPVTEREMDKQKIQLGANGVTLTCPLNDTLQLEVISVPNFWKHSLWFVNEDDLGVRYPFEPGWKKDPFTGNVLTWNGNEYAGYDLITGSLMATWGLIGHPIEHACMTGILDPEVEPEIEA